MISTSHPCNSWCDHVFLQLFLKGRMGWSYIIARFMFHFFFVAKCHQKRSPQKEGFWEASWFSEAVFVIVFYGGHGGHRKPWIMASRCAMFCKKITLRSSFSIWWQSLDWLVLEMVGMNIKRYTRHLCFMWIQYYRYALFHHYMIHIHISYIAIGYRLKMHTLYKDYIEYRVFTWIFSGSSEWQVVSHGWRSEFLV